MTRDLVQYIEVNHTRGTTILKVVDPEVLADEKAALYALADGEAGPTLSNQVVLSLVNVRTFKSLMIATLINFQKKIKERGGRLKICSIDPDVLRLFQLTRLDQILDLRKDEQDAIDSFGGSSSPGWFSRLFGSK